MTTAELTLLLKSLAPAVSEFVTRAVAGVSERVAVLEQRVATVRDGCDGSPGRDGKDAEPVDLDAVVKIAVGLIPVPKDGAPGEQGAPGRDADTTAIEASLAECVAIKSQMTALLAGYQDLLTSTVTSEVAKAVAALPVAKDGRDGVNGKDGVGLAGTVIDQDGNLVVTLSNGTIERLGRVEGKDGAPGAPGERGIDGMHGKDGRDGVGWQDMDETVEDEGRVTVRRYLHDGSVVKEFRHTTAHLIYRGVYAPGRTYQRGDTATWGGSLWHCNETTTAKPGETKAWTLMAKKGGDGKAGPIGPRGDQGLMGPQGPPGPRVY
jgi:hypothetical protein